MKTRVILCTSAMQVINAKSATIYLNRGTSFKSYVIIIHPSLTQESKFTIYNYSKRFDFEVIDLSNIFELEKGIEISYNNFFKLIFLKFKNLLKTYNFYNKIRQKKIKRISNILRKKFDEVDELYIRSNYKSLDLAFYQAINNIKETLVIEDGQYDFKNSEFQSWNLFFRQSKHKILNNTYRFILFFFTFLTTLNFKKSLSNNFDFKITYEYKFNNFEIQDTINTSLITREVFKNYSITKHKKNTKSVIIIIGTVFKNWEIHEEDEILIYKILIKKLKQQFSINKENILYKPHPRATNVNLKIKELDCTILQDKNILVEEYLANSNIHSVFSLGSTSILYSQTIFKIKSYFIDVKDIKNKFKIPYGAERFHDSVMFRKLGIKNFVL